MEEPLVGEALACEAGTGARIDFYNPDDCCWEEDDVDELARTTFEDESELMDDVPMLRGTSPFNKGAADVKLDVDERAWQRGGP